MKSRYGLSVSQIKLLHLGADPKSIVYQVVANGEEFFLKLRLGDFEEASIAVPRFLKDLGVEVIAPIPTKDQELWTSLEHSHLVLYPFITGKNAIEAPLSDAQWVDFGAALKTIHTVEVPADLKRLLHKEEFSSSARNSVKRYLESVESETFDESLAAEVADFLRANQEEILRLVDRTEALSASLRNLAFVLCHTDIFAANLLIDASGRCYLVDWDNPMLAPKERDLMYIGAGICDVWNTERESELFYKGYGAVDVDPVALVYYRYERIVQDIAIEAEMIFSGDTGFAEREREFGFMKSNFVPGGVLEIATATDKDLLSHVES